MQSARLPNRKRGNSRSATIVPAYIAEAYIFLWIMREGGMVALIVLMLLLLVAAVVLIASFV